jgi:peptidoglycan/xylan/chitin deacetylase (PgdA/CDA1 family)
MKILKEKDVPATFFFVGQHALLQPDVVLETARNGL